MEYPPILTTVAYAFAHTTMRQRLPAVIRAVIETNEDYPKEIKDELASFAEEVGTGAPLRALAHAAGDDWQDVYTAYHAAGWLAVRG